MPTPLNTPSANLLDLPSTSTPANLGATASSGVSNSPSASDHVHQIPALTGDVTSTAGSLATSVVKIQGKAVTSAVPAAGSILQWDGANIVWGTPTQSGGGGNAGVTFYLNYSTTPDNPLTGLPALANSVVYKELGRSPNSGATSVTSAVLTNAGTYTNVCGFVTDILDPDVTSIPVGLWDFNIWASTDDTQVGTSIKVAVYKYTAAGGSTLLVESTGAAVTDAVSLINLTVTLPQTTVAIDDRIVLVLQAASSNNNHTVTFNFGATMPSHTHTTIPIVGGTGLVRVINGGIQSQGTKISNADVDDNAAIAVSKISGAATTTQLASYVLSTKLGQASGVAELGADSKLKTSQIPALTTADITGLSASGIGAVASGDLTTTNTPNGVVKLSSNGTISTDQLATISGLPSGAQGSATVVPIVTVDSKGRVTALSTTTITGGGTITSSGSPVSGNIAKFTSSTNLAPAISGIDYVSGVDSSSYAVVAVSTGNITPTTPTSTVLTFSVGVQAAVDGHTLVLNDIVLLTGQSTPNQNGPWQVVTVGTGSVAAVWTRPNWFTTSTARSGIMMSVSNGSTLQGNTYSVFPSTASDSAITVGTTNLNVVLVGGRSALPISQGGTGQTTVPDATRALGGVQIAQIRNTATVPLATAATLANGIFETSSARVTYNSATSPVVVGMSSSVITGGVVLSSDATPCSFTGSFVGAGNTLTISSVASGNLAVGSIISGGTIVGNATFNGTISGTTLTITALSGTIAVGSSIKGTGVTAGTTVSAIVTAGTTYTLSTSSTVASSTGMVSSVVVTAAAAGGLAGSYTVNVAQAISTTATTGSGVLTMTTTSGSSGIAATVTLYNSTPTTLVTSSVTVMDGRTMQVGDIWIASGQTSGVQNGPWKIDSIGTGFSCSRPSWFTGTLIGPVLVQVQYGTGNTGTIVSLQSSSTLLTGSITIGIDQISPLIAVGGRVNTAGTSSNVFSGPQTLRATTAGTSQCPILFQAGTSLMSTQQAHAVEWFADTLYITTAAAVRKAVPFTDNIGMIQSAIVSQVSAQTVATAGTITTNASWYTGIANIFYTTYTANTAAAIVVGQQAFASGLGQSNIIKTAPASAVCSFNGTIAGITLTASAPITGTILLGATIATGATAGTKIIAFVSGTNGGAGTYTVSTTQTTASVTMTTAGLYFQVTTAPTNTSTAATVTINNSTPTTITWTAGTTYDTIDGVALAVGNTVLLTAQTCTPWNGPWQVTTLGAASTSAVWTRPSWFQGTLGSVSGVGIQQGTTYNGYYFIISGQNTNSPTVIGYDGLVVSAATSRGTNASWGIKNFYSQSQVLAVGTTTIAPLQFQTGVALTTPISGAVEWDGTSMYLTSGFSLTGTWSNGSALVTAVSSTANLVVGAQILTGITGTTLTVASITSSTTFTLSGNATNNGSGVAFTVTSRRKVSVVTNSVTVSELAPSGGNEGDIWYQY